MTLIQCDELKTLCEKAGVRLHLVGSNDAGVYAALDMEAAGAMPSRLEPGTALSMCVTTRYTYGAF